MKKTIIKLLLVPVVALSVGCIEDADVTGYMTEGKRQEISKNDPDKVFAATVAGMYTDMQQYVATNMQHNYFGQKSFDYLTSLMGNDMIMTNRYGMSIYHYLIDYRGRDYIPTANRWKEYYLCIDNANKILGSISDDETDPAVLKYKAIAQGFRGYAYAQLTYLYQYSYYVGVEGSKWGKGDVYDHSEELCVPIVTDKITGTQARSTVKQVYEQIVGDLTSSYDTFKALGMEKTAAPTDMDGCVAALYLSRAYMVLNDWDNAIKYAKVVTDNFPVLTTEDQITQGFSDITLPDIVFGCDINADNATAYMSWFSQMDAYGGGYAGDPIYRAGFKPFVDRIGDDDIRLQWFCCERSTGWDDETDLPWLRDFVDVYEASVDYQSVKFIGTGRPNIKAGKFDGWHLGDYIYLRSEEAYLITAEALAHKGDANAVTTLTTFMTTRNPNYTYTFTNKADLLEEINYQKRVEFWGEGMEYLDNRRLNIPVDRRDATWGAANNNHFPGAKLYVTQEDILFLYQIPTSEVENNDKIVQNP